jgi:hypothetical protein
MDMALSAMRDANKEHTVFHMQWRMAIPVLYKSFTTATIAAVCGPIICSWVLIQTMWLIRWQKTGRRGVKEFLLVKSIRSTNCPKSKLTRYADATQWEGSHINSYQKSLGFALRKSGIS